MPRVKIDYVVSFSSEDPENQASNLLSWEVSKKKWLCSKGETSCSVVLQLARAVKISSVQIGAHQAALVEVLVGRSETPSEPFQVLVPSSVFLSPAESRAGGGAGQRVRSCGGGALAAAARAQRWDRVRVVCSQPYNKHCKYGLSFIHIFEPDSESAPALAPAPAPMVPLRLLELENFSSDEEEFHPGELFAKHRQSGGDTGSQIRHATLQALKNNSDAATKLMKTSLTKNKTTTSSERTEPPARRDKDNLMYTKDDERPHAKIDLIVQRHKDEKSKDNTPKPKEKVKEDIDKTPRSKEPSGGSSESKRDTDKVDSRRERNSKLADASGASSKKKDESRKRLHSDRKRPENAADSSLRPGAQAHEPLRGVVFVMSGYQNPERARLRELALSLGARAQREWGPSCTHLICAFSNTPKLAELRAHPAGGAAAVPTGEWLRDCARRRRRLPWQWYAAEPSRRLPPPADDDDEPAHDSEQDTDDEIEKVLHQQKKARASPSPSPSPRPASPSPSRPRPRSPRTRARSGGSDDVEFVRDERMQGNITVEDSDSDGGGDTDVEAPGAREQVCAGAALPALLGGRTLVLDEPLLAPLDAQLLTRYCVAYGGLALKSSDVDEDTGEHYVLCGGGAAGGAAPAQAGGAAPAQAGGAAPAQAGGAAPAQAGGLKGRRVRARWLWASHAAGKLLAVDDYLLD